MKKILMPYQKEMIEGKSGFPLILKIRQGWFKNSDGFKNFHIYMYLIPTNSSRKYILLKELIVKNNKDLKKYKRWITDLIDCFESNEYPDFFQEEIDKALKHGGEISENNNKAMELYLKTLAEKWSHAPNNLNKTVGELMFSSF
jgi:hypothetical protein